MSKLYPIPADNHKLMVIIYSTAIGMMLGALSGRIGVILGYPLLGTVLAVTMGYIVGLWTRKKLEAAEKRINP